MNPNPKTIEAKELAIDALELLQKIIFLGWLLQKMVKYAGMVHLHDLLRKDWYSSFILINS